MLWSALADAMVNMWDVDVATFLKTSRRGPTSEDL